MAGLRVKGWDEWEVPPMWVWVVAGVVLIAISTVVFWQIGERLSADAKAAVRPVSAPAARGNPNDPDSF